MVGWARPILDVVFDGVSDTVDSEVQQICGGPHGRRRYFRLQAKLDIAKDEMDDASRENIHALRLQAEQLLEGHSDDLDKVVEELAAASSHA